MSGRDAYMMRTTSSRHPPAKAEGAVRHGWLSHDREGGFQVTTNYALDGTIGPTLSRQNPRLITDLTSLGVMAELGMRGAHLGFRTAQ